MGVKLHFKSNNVKRLQNSLKRIKMKLNEIEMKFISNLIENKEYVHLMKKVISDTLNELFNENILDKHVKGNI